MYKPFGCKKCDGEGEISKRHGGCNYYPSYNYIRCECSYKKTKKFAKSKQKDKDKFFDNHADLGSSAMDGW